MPNVHIPNETGYEKPVEAAAEAQAQHGSPDNPDDFASELPDWNLLPPAMVVKRVRRSSL